METKWTPSSPEERAYYDRLFALADVSKGGKLGGDSVVPFLAKSGLGFGVLKEVSGCSRVMFTPSSSSSMVHV